MSEVPIDDKNTNLDEDWPINTGQDTGQDWPDYEPDIGGAQAVWGQEEEINPFLLGDMYIILLESKEKPFLGKIDSIFEEEKTVYLTDTKENTFIFSYTDDYNFVLKTKDYDVIEIIQVKPFDVEVDMVTNEETITKTRYIDKKSNQQIIRVDEQPEIEALEFDFTDDGGDDYDALIISDYDKGFITQEQLFKLVYWFRGPVFMDSKKKNLPDKGYIKVNDIEYDKLETKTDNVIVTRGGAGTEYQGKLYPAEKVNVFDVVGAGDTFLAALVVGYLTTKSIETAIPLANKAAAVAVSHTGTYVLTKEDVNEVLR